ncbi:LytR C-terminal domain-containing protein [Ruminiclostridium cellobioparum]|uniref:LytR/CpsA/Psr regulator C-terminal domain-containing protein n=1 Tax=Ruminiclostridium cellobioparum subsp. termitidis CT1112 TaxID=1195236 RepID=S0FI51_RUMCE|nr:LytR C-terminal domain-containing protein [Ruminiclostridium cellobioparum]EMS69716.1 hypothetical protein CTER_4649 [Ruminiclostridium cellobioparum subsp. termitidis CT1112]
MSNKSNVSKFMKIAFYTIGTFLLLFSSIIVGANFTRDSGVFDKEVVEVKKQTPKEQSSESSAPKKIIVDSESTKKSEPSKDTVAQSTVDNKKLIIEVLNCTDKNGLAEDTRGMLEAQGYKVSAGTNAEKQGTSQIIIRKKGVIPDVIKDVLKISVVKEELQPDSRYDVTIILGSDFNP